jgi:hypothetical protein
MNALFADKVPDIKGPVGHEAEGGAVGKIVGGRSNGMVERVVAVTVAVGVTGAFRFLLFFDGLAGLEGLDALVKDDPTAS